ncbi:PTR2-domain-containing protein [Wallemia mellicola]|nr:PTR2-domain-containing protein [Wallemia mellicola]
MSPVEYNGTILEKDNNSDNKSENKSERTQKGSQEETLTNFPTDHEFATLRKVSESVSLYALAIVVVELAERFSIQYPLPYGSITGTPLAGDVDTSPGVMGRGQQVATGLTTFSTFWSYLTPVLGGIIADTQGRYITIIASSLIYFIGLLILTLTSIPSAITNNTTPLAGWITATILIGLGTGGIKANISVLLGEQIKSSVPYTQVLKTGEKVIVDPNVTIQRLMSWFYWSINVGSLSMLVSPAIEKNHSFWLAFTIPTVVFAAVPFILFALRNKLVHTPPRGTVLLEVSRLLRIVAKNIYSFNPIRWIRNLKDTQSSWNAAKPSVYEKEHGFVPKFITWDDAFVLEVKRGWSACKIFFCLIFYYISQNQLSNNLVSLSTTMQSGNTPPEVVKIIDPIMILATIPILDFLVYPFLRKKGIRFGPVLRIASGFILASLSMVYAAVIQHYVYTISPCGEYAATCNTKAPQNLWLQIVAPSYALMALSEVFGPVTAYELALKKAPVKLRAFVTSIFLVQTAFASAINEALVSVSEDPYLVWMYASLAIVTFLAGFAFYAMFHKRDRNEEAENAIGKDRQE